MKSQVSIIAREKSKILLLFLSNLIYRNPIRCSSLCVRQKNEKHGPKKDRKLNFDLKSNLQIKKRRPRMKCDDG